MLRRAVREIEHDWIPMPDGVRLSARLWLPEGAPAPAILEYIPYRKRDMVRRRDERNHPVFARAGYACLRVDMRGSGDSEGVMPDMYSADELNDAQHVIEWIAAQVWCDGSVGMFGTSWGGTASLQAAAQKPEALKAIIAVSATDDRFDDDIHHMGGCQSTDTLEWGATLPVILALPPDPDCVGSDWRKIWMDRLQAATFPIENWLRHEARGDYWRHGSVSATPGALGCPTLAIGGWMDRYSNTVMNLLADNPDNVWGVVGPWGHHFPDVAQPGPGIDFQAMALRWWDRWLKGVDNGADHDPRLSVWVQDRVTPANWIGSRPGRGIAKSTWRQGAAREFGLSEEALVSGPSADQAATVPFSFRSGLHAGDTGYFGRIGGAPLDQQADDSASLVFDSLPLGQDLEILGAPVLTFPAGPDAGGAITARLCDVAADGSSARVTYGTRNLALNASGDARGPNIAATTIKMHNTAYRFAAGSCIRLALSAAYWPMIWPVAGTMAIDLNLKGSKLSLPLLGDYSESPETFISTTRPGPAEQDGPDRYADTGTAEMTVGWHQPPVRTELDEIELSLTAETKAVHQITEGNPLSARTEVTHSLTLCRPDGTFTATGRVALSATETNYHLDCELTVTEGGATVLRRKTSPKIPRNLA